ncbi:hypothetical protein GCM10011515_06670 [Tsuneonella deserti]|uniref:DUF3347 domain-containing protein n=1 Tax=Tsuneonella deserti TaxID=2035528 RepID=A0ABQ1S395_9SPHN|nr:hypothetical protein [Tsuneonella deserti]GGD89737.1 hypothetical protein GCM10011515_06670 [Tsuneonella deserti]
MRLIMLSLAILLSAPPLSAQATTSGPLQPVQPRSAVPVQRDDVSVNNPTKMQLRVQIQQLEAKVDELTSLIEAQSTLLATVNGNLTSVQAALGNFRASADKQHTKLRTTSFLDCYQTAAYSTWGYGEGEIALKHCTGELGAQGITIPY